MSRDGGWTAAETAETGAASPVLFCFAAFAWLQVAVFVAVFARLGLGDVLGAAFWLSAVAGGLGGLVLVRTEHWRAGHRAGLRLAVWWGGAGPPVLLTVLAFAQTGWTFFGVVLAGCVVFGLALGLPVGLAVAALARRLGVPDLPSGSLN